MDLYDVMRTTFSAREFTDDPVPDEALYTILDNARFASSGGNRQGWRVIVIRDPVIKSALADLQIPAIKRYMAQVRAGENPFNTVDPTTVDAATIERTPVPQRTLDAIANAPVVLVVCVDLRVVASIDQHLPRVGVISGASIYPFVWNILLAARNEGYGGTLTTWAVAAEDELKALLGIPPHVAVAAVIPFGRPTIRRTKLTRKPVSEFTTLERWNGPPLTPQ
jgi:nitroreductase